MNIQSYYQTNLDAVRNISLDERSKYLRSLIFRAVLNGGRGHVGPALSLVETIRVLYDDILNINPKDPKSPQRDRYLLSKGHGCLALYAQLADLGFFSVSDLDQFCKFDSFLSGHPEIVTPGVEASTGALGHGMSIGVGIAIALRNKRSQSQVYVHVGDGEINEGSVWEAASCAGKYLLGNLNIILDYNKLQSAGSVFEVQPMEPLKSKWESFGFYVLECNGHDLEELREKLTTMKNFKSKSTILICHTIKGKGLPLAEHNPAWHHKSKLSDKEIEIIKNCFEK